MLCFQLYVKTVNQIIMNKIKFKINQMLLNELRVSILDIMSQLNCESALHFYTAHTLKSLYHKVLKLDIKFLHSDKEEQVISFDIVDIIALSHTFTKVQTSNQLMVLYTMLFKHLPINSRKV